MSVATIVLKSDFSRRIPDPIFRNSRMERHILFCRAATIPDELPKDPNPRHQNIDRGIYREVARSLTNDLGTPSTFHLKNKGITIIAEEVREVAKGSYELVLAAGQGIVDGAHTYEIIRRHRADCPDDQYVRVEVLTGIDRDLIPEIAGGLNTAMQVQQMSLANLSGEFEWLKGALNSTYRKVVAFKENEEGSVDARDVVALLTLFNVDLYPNDGQEYPIRAYTSKEQTLAQYLKRRATFERMSPIVNDVLTLHDQVHLVARDEHNRAGGKAGKLAFMRNRKRGEFVLPFTQTPTPYMLFDGALYPMLGAFRWMVKTDGTAKLASWKSYGGHDGVAGVMRLLKSVCSELMRSTQGKSEDLGRKPNAIGKDRGHWENLFKTVALREMQQRS